MTENKMYANMILQPNYIDSLRKKNNASNCCSYISLCLFIHHNGKDTKLSSKTNIVSLTSQHRKQFLSPNSIQTATHSWIFTPGE